MVQRPWLSHYDDGVPTTLEPYPELTLVDYLAATARDEPEHPVVLFKGTTLSAARLERLSNAFAAALVEYGVAPGDRIVLLLPNCPQFLIAQFGAWKAGAIVAPLNPMFSGDELIALVSAIAPTVIVTLSAFYGRAKEVQQRARVEHLIVTSIKEHLPAHSRLIFTLFREARGGHRVRLGRDDEWMPDLLESYRGALRPSVSLVPDDDATLLPSGGTTGLPKLVLGSHRAAVASGFQLSAWLRELAEPGRDVIMLPLPLFHVYGLSLVQGIALMARLPLALVPDPRDTTDVVRAIQRVRPAFFSGVPALYHAVLSHPLVRTGKVDFSSLKMCFCGAAPLLAETRARFEAVTGCPIIEGYGLTESQSANTVNPVTGARKIGSVGMPLPDTAVRIRDVDTGSHDVPLGTVGEIWLSCPQRMRRYWGHDEETDRTIVEADGETWLRTGDLGYLDDDGYLFIVDRMKDLIKIGGFQVWPREIEEIIAMHPAVAEVGVAAVPDPRRGEVARAWIVPAADRVPTEDEIRAHCAQHLVSYKIPALITFCDSLPKTSVGKVLRRTLVERHTAEARAAASLGQAMSDRSVDVERHDERGADVPGADAGVLSGTRERSRTHHAPR